MASEKVESKFKKITVNFSNNWNKKLYGKYFTTIRKADYKIFKNDLVEICLNSKPIMMCKVVECDILYFHELGQVLVQTDTGYSYSESLDIFYKMGINVKSFETQVKVILFECQQIYNQPKPTA